MASNWEKPDFEVMTVGAECTAYSGSQAAMQQQSARPGPGGAAGESPSRHDNLLSATSVAEKGDTRQV